MTRTRRWIVALSTVALLFLASCGGGDGQGLRVESDPVVVTSTSIPPCVSGEVLKHVIPIEGGCGGPYVLKVIEGEMPDALELDNETHAIVGGVLDVGDFEFTVQVIDTGCEPFLSTTATFQMEVDIGEIKVVDVTRDGNSVLIPPGGASYNPDYPSIGSVVYNEYATIEFVVAGGEGPYGATIFDDPDIPNDGALPLGASIPPNSTSINGSPVEVGPDGGPFLITVEITDRVGGKGYFTFYWYVDTPPIIFATGDWSPGQAGVNYTAQIFVAEGVPPFAYEFVEQGLPADYTSDKADNPNLDPTAEVIYNPGAPPTVVPPEALVKIDETYYPGEAEAITIPGVPPEGAFLNEESGSFTGVPRRPGAFTVNAHIQSTLVPNSFGQHAWGTIALDITAPPALEQDPAYTQVPAFSDTKPYAPIAEANEGEVYNPDGGLKGLQLLATGGVPEDGWHDAPHISQRTQDSDENIGGYQWDIDWNPDNDTEEPFGQVPGMELVPDGRFRVIEIGGVSQVDALIPEFPQSIAFIVADSVLPTTLILPVEDRTEKLQFAVGPDRVLVTESTSPMTNSTANKNWDDSMMTIKYVIPGGVSTLRPPNDSDLTGKDATRHDLPATAGTTTVADMLTDLDLLRVTINPTLYWDDNTFLNPNAARPFQNSHRCRYYSLYGPGSSGSTSYSGSNTSSYGTQPETACVRLPKCKDLALLENKDLGIYPDGGKFHVFDTATHFGVMIVRRDGKLYIPAAFERSSSGYYSFGDNWNQKHGPAATTHSHGRIPQMTVSPDGKIAALKLRTSTSLSYSEYASTTPILLISLTGERIAAWGNEVYKIVGAGPTTNSSATGYRLYASSLTLTNEHLYYIIGNQTSYAHLKDHYIYRYTVRGGAGAGAFMPGPSVFDPEWTNGYNARMQVPFQTFRTFGSTSGGTYADQYPGGYNCWEGSTAPHPFRVNTQGNACAILAGKNTTGTSGSYQDMLYHHVWVDYEGSLKRLSNQRRHTSGGGRGVALHSGVYYYMCSVWGDMSGPTSRFEISDDGLKVAVVYYRNKTVDGYTDYNDTVIRYREDIAAYTSTDSAWGGVTVHEVTGDSSVNTGAYLTGYTEKVTGNFPTGHSSTNYDNVWRFGALTFTKDGTGLIFWGGFSLFDPDGYTMDQLRNQGCKSFAGSLYAYDFRTAYNPSKRVMNILSSTYGGCNYSPGYLGYSSFTFTASQWGTAQGMIKPVAGFRSQNGNFLYMATRGAVSGSSTYRRDGALIGVNVSTMSSGSINGKTNGRAFYVNGFGTYNGFLAAHHYYHAYGMGHANYMSGVNTYLYAYHHYYTLLGYNDRVAAMDNGRVFFTSVTATASTNYYANTSSTYWGRYAPARQITYGYGYPYYKKVLYMFDANVGGNIQVLGGPGWTNTSNYQHVQGLVVSDDGTSLIEAGSIYNSTYNYMDRMNLTVFSGIDLNVDTGALVGTPQRQKFESTTCVGGCASFSQRLDTVYYAQGGGATSMEIKRVPVDGTTTTGEALGLPTKRWSVIHSGRK